MATIDANQAKAVNTAGAYQADDDVQASKRTSIGLSAHRPTAPSTVQRPPQAGLRLSGWWLVFCMILLIVAVSLLIGARALDSVSSWVEVADSFRPDRVTTAGAPYTTSQVYFFDTFEGDNTFLKSATLFDGSAATRVVADGIYRMHVLPERMAWNRFVVDNATVLAIDIDATIDSQTPDAAVGLIGRFEDEANFYLFTVDGQGRFSAVHYVGGAPQTIQAPTPLAALQPAGQRNQLILKEEGAQLSFLGNGVPLINVPTDSTPSKRIGFGALAEGAGNGVVTFDKIGVYRP